MEERKKKWEKKTMKTKKETPWSKFLLSDSFVGFCKMRIIIFPLFLENICVCVVLIFIKIKYF